jgi:hypothetical protein
LEEINPSQKEAIQIDVSLEKGEKRNAHNGDDNKDDKEDSSNESDSNNDAVGENNASQKPMIEMNVALGNFDSNPIVSSLLNNDDDEPDSLTGSDDNENKRITDNEINELKDSNSPKRKCISLIQNMTEEGKSSNVNGNTGSIANDNDGSQLEGKKDDNDSPFLTEISTRRLK